MDLWLYQNNCISGSKSSDIGTGDNFTALPVHLSTEIFDDRECLCPQTQVWRCILFRWSTSRTVKQNRCITSLHHHKHNILLYFLYSTKMKNMSQYEMTQCTDQYYYCDINHYVNFYMISSHSPSHHLSYPMY